MSTNIDVPGMPTGTPTGDQWQKLFDQVTAAVEKNPQHPLLVGRVDGNPVQIRPPWRPNQEAWLAGINGNGKERWVKGVQNPRADFKSAALANNDGWKQGVQDAVKDDRFAKGMQKVDVDAAIETAVKIGAQGYADGAAARADKYTKNVDAIAAKMGAVVEVVRKMPAKTDADREQRMLTMVRGARAAAKGK